MTWEQFRHQAPHLAAQAEALFAQAGVVLVGTVRRDGSPRISPVEPLITDGRLYLGMMRRSLKAQDLVRDPRCTVHSAVPDRLAGDGEFKVHGHALEVREPAERGRFEEALFGKIGWKPEPADYCLFGVEVQSAGLLLSGEGAWRVLTRWRAGEAVRTFRQHADGRLVPVP